MKFGMLLLICVSLAMVTCRPTEETSESGIIPILRHEQVYDQHGQYAMRYVSGDGTTVVEEGALKINAAGDGHVLVKKGSISYRAPDGTPITLEYIADENGFQPQGSHIPTVVPPLTVDA